MFSHFILFSLVCDCGLNTYAATHEDTVELSDYQKVKSVSELNGDVQVCITQRNEFSDTEQLRRSVAKKYLAQLSDDASKEPWVDPYDMFNFKELSSEDINKKVVFDKDVMASDIRKETQTKEFESNDEYWRNEPVESVLSSTGESKLLSMEDEGDFMKCDFVYLRRWVKIFLNKINLNPNIKMEEIRIVQFAVKNQELFALKNMMNSQPQDMFAIDTVISKIVTDVQVLKLRDSWWLTAKELVTSDIFSVIAGIVFSLILSYGLFCSLQNYPVKTFLFLIFVISVAMSWYNIYQKKVAEKYATLDSVNYPTECHKENLGYFTLFINTYIFDNGNKCAKYYEAQMVDPVFKVSLLMAISETVANTVLQPLGTMGNHLNIFLKELYYDMSFVMMIPVTVLLLFIVIMIFGYKIRMPFFFASLEPTVHTRNFSSTESVQQNTSERYKRCPIIQMSKTVIHVTEDRIKSRTDQIKEYDLTFTEANDLIDWNEDVCPSLSQLPIVEEPTKDVKDFVVNSAGDCRNNVRQKCELCFLNTKMCGHYSTETVQNIEECNKCLDIKVKNNACLEELTFDSKIMILQDENETNFL